MFWPAQLSQAQVSQPVLVVTAPGYNELLADADFLGALAGRPGSSQMADGMLKMMTQGKGLNGLDATKPLGVIVSVENNEFTPVVMVPVKSAKDLVDSLAAFVGPPQDDSGVMKITVQQTGTDVYIREKDGWAYLTQTKDAPLPLVSSKAIAALANDYDIAARVYLQNVPAEMKKSGIEKFRTFMQFAAQQQQQGGDNPLAAINQKNMEGQVAAIEKLLNEADQITIGWKLNRQQKNTHFDVTFTAVPGSELDQELQQAAKAKTNFAGFLMPDAAATMNLCSVNSPSNIEQAINTLEQVKAKATESIENDSALHRDDPKQEEEAKKQAKLVLNQFIDIAEKTVKSGKADGGAVLQLGPGQFQAAVGGYIVDGPSLETAVKNLVELAKGDPDAKDNFTVKFDLETYKDVKFHQISVKLPPEADEEAKKVFGDTVELYIGAAPNAAYAAVGKGSLDLVKSVIDRSAADPNKSVQPLTLSIALAPIFKFAANLDPNNSQLTMLAGAFEKAKGKDHILVSAKLIPNGLTYRLEVEDGVLTNLGATAKAHMQGGPAGGGFQGGPPPGGNFIPGN